MISNLMQTTHFVHCDAVCRPCGELVVHGKLEEIFVVMHVSFGQDAFMLASHFEC